MATKNSRFASARAGFTETTAGRLLPKISTGLDSVRVYQFEVQFYNVPNVGEEILTLAAKQVEAHGFTSEAIEVNRLNDKVYYPGKATPDILTVTFDNLVEGTVPVGLFDWFRQATYDPFSGNLGGGINTATGQFEGFKALKATILQLDNARKPIGWSEVYGVFPITYKLAEFNYNNNLFHTITVGFRYDFMNVGRFDMPQGSRSTGTEAPNTGSILA